MQQGGRAVHRLLVDCLVGTCFLVTSPCFGFAPPLRFQRLLPTVLLSEHLEHTIADSMFWPDKQHDDNQEPDDNDPLTTVLDSIGTSLTLTDHLFLSQCSSLPSLSVKIHCTHSEPDPILPWQKNPQSMSTSSGFVIQLLDNSDDNDDETKLYIMTNAHSVEFGSITQVQKRGSETKYRAQIYAFCNECDLAILDVVDTTFWEQSSLEPLQFGNLPALQDEVEVLGYPTGGDSLSITQGVVSRIEMQEYTQSSSHLLAIQIDAAINAGNSGGPVVNDDLKVIGVAFQGLDDAENIGYVVPVTIVQHILQDIQRNNKYTGFCSLGVGAALLENTSFRKYLGMTKTSNLSGVMVKSVGPTSLAKDLLLPNDVILSVDKIKVGNDGKIPFRRGERVALACYIHTKITGDTVCIQVLRQGKKLELDVPVEIPKRLVPTHWKNRPPPYLVVGGLIFTALSVPYLTACGAWEDYVSSNVSYLSGLIYRTLEKESDQVVILIQVLAHPENLGYDTMADLHLERLNGQRVRYVAFCWFAVSFAKVLLTFHLFSRSLRHLKTLIDESKEDFLRLEFSPENRIVVMERSTLSKVTAEVCEEHSIQRPFYLHDSDDQSIASELAAQIESKATITNGSGLSE